MPTLDTIVCDFHTARSILKQSENFDSLAELCEAYRVSVSELEGAILFYGLPYPTFLTPLERRIKETYKEMKKAKLTQPELARYYGTTVSQLRFILLRLGYIRDRKIKTGEIRADFPWATM